MSRKKSTGALPSKAAGNAGIVLLLIVIFGIIIRLIFFSGIGTSDDLAYTGYAHSLSKGEIKGDTLTLSTRLGLIYPLSVLYSLFGVNDFSSVLFVLLAAIGNIILVFYFGKLLFNENVGLISAFLLSIFPLEVVYSTKLFSDIPSAFFMALGVYLFLYSEKKTPNPLLYVISGLSIGIGYLIRESALLIGLFFIFYILYKRQIKKEYFLVPIGVLAIFALEALVFYQLTGNPFFRWEESQKYLAEAVKVHNYFGRLDFPSGLFHYPYIILASKLLSLFYIFIFAAVVYCIIYKRKRSYEMLLWFIPLLLYLSFGSSSFSEYIPFKAADRYLEIVTVPGILLLGFFLQENKFSKWKPFMLILLLAASISLTYWNGGRNELGNLRNSYNEIKNIEKPVYIDERSLKALNYIGGYTEFIKAQEYPKSFANIRDSYVVINNDMLQRLRDANKNAKFPTELDNIPRKWVLFKEPGENILIYYIP